MKLLSMQLHNFRQFYGVSPVLAFAAGERNVTVLHGVNGAGKTAFLNAFTWLLFDRFTRGFRHTEELINKRALLEAKPGANVEAWVELQFKHSHNEYILRKRTACQVAENGIQKGCLEPETTLQFRDGSGELFDEENYREAIGRILPEDLRHYFFFDGERIERLVQPSSSEKADLSKAAKKLMRVEILDRAESHLDKARAELQTELQGVGTPRTGELVQLREADEKALVALREQRQELKQNIEAFKEREGVINTRLGEIKHLEELQSQREELKRRDKELREEQRTNHDELISELGKDGYAVFLREPVSRFGSLLEGLRSRGELPAGIKRQFVDDLLGDGKCICGRELLEGSNAWDCVRGFRERAGLADVEESAIWLKGQTDELPDRVSAFWERIDRIRERTVAIRKERSIIEDKLAEIGDKILHSDVEGAAALERRLRETQLHIRENEKELFAADRDIKRKKEEIDDVDIKLEQEEGRDARHKTAKKRVAVARETLNLVRNTRELFEEKFRDAITNRMSCLFRENTVTPYTPHISKEYEIQLLDTTSGTAIPVASSQGESQILALCFIASVIEETGASGICVGKIIERCSDRARGRRDERTGRV